MLFSSYFVCHSVEYEEKETNFIREQFLFTTLINIILKKLIFSIDFYIKWKLTLCKTNILDNFVDNCLSDTQFHNFF